MMFPFLRRLRVLSGILILMMMAVAMWSLWRHLGSKSLPYHDNLAIKTGLEVLAGAIVPLQEGDPEFKWTAENTCHGPKTEERLKLFDGYLRNGFTSNDGRVVVPGGYRLDVVRLEELINLAKANGIDVQGEGDQDEIVSASGERQVQQEFRCTSMQGTIRYLALDNFENLHILRFGDRLPKTKQQSGLDGKTAYADFSNESDRTPDQWRGLPGCLFAEGSKSHFVIPPRDQDARSAQLCEQAMRELWKGRGKEADALNTASGVLAQYQKSKLDRNILPLDGSFLRDAAWSLLGGRESRNRITIMGHSVPQSPHAVTTIRPEEQRVLQNIVECYTGNTEKCGGHLPPNNALYYENAVTRMAGALLVDIRTGEIVAAASADTACYRADNSAQVRPESCPALPSPPRFNQNMLVNHALYYGYQPGSLVKPMMALGILQDAQHGLSHKNLASMLAQSDSSGFLDAFLCKNKGFANCERPLMAFRAAERMGLNQDCAENQDCARYGLMQGWPQKHDSEESSHKESSLYRTGIWGMEVSTENDSEQKRYYVVEAPDSEKADMCSKVRWENKRQISEEGEKRRRACFSSQLRDYRAHGFGQGNSYMTPLGVALVWSHLGNAASERSTVYSPHLLKHAFLAVDGEKEELPLQTYAMKTVPQAEHARWIIDGMSGSSQRHMGGTAKGECERVIGNCNSLQSWVAGKTGTPGESRNLNDPGWQAACRGDRQSGSCFYQPVKWYAALLGDPNTKVSTAQAQRDWRYALVVVVQRNWQVRNGVMGGDNMAADIAFRYIKYYQNRARHHAAQQAYQARMESIQ